MAIARTQYITIAELNEILGTTYTNDNLINIYEASEMLEYYMNDDINSYDVSNAPDKLKLATAYQTKYMIEYDDDTYDSSSNGFSLGKFSINNSNSGNGGIVNGDYKKISPKARQYLLEGNLLKRVGVI